MFAIDAVIGADIFVGARDEEYIRQGDLGTDSEIIAGEIFAHHFLQHQVKRVLGRGEEIFAQPIGKRKFFDLCGFLGL